jgi:hypothetical protein
VALERKLTVEMDHKNEPEINQMSEVSEESKESVI